MKRVLTRIFDAAYPGTCPGCGDLPGEPPTGLCAACSRTVEPIAGHCCPKCGLPHPTGVPSNLPHRCANCAGLRLHFAFATAAHHHTGAVRQALHRLKYRHAGSLAGPLAHLLLPALDDPRIRDNPEPWVLVPAPVHFRRKIERGYNQAAELAHRVGRLAGLETRDALRVRGFRHRHHQMELGRRERLSALHSALALRLPPLAKRHLHGRHVLLIDDTLTTGATASACARVLTSQAGAQKVAVATLSRS